MVETRAHLRNVRAMDWDKLRIFHAVADAGSLTHAGDTLHLSQSAVSRQIRALEEAAERRRKEKAQAERPAERNGPSGEEPTRYGDWERGGIAYDF